MAIELIDDGTLDTVLRCSECGEEMRYNFDPMDDTSDAPDPDSGEVDAYYAFVDWAMEDAESEHRCSREERVLES